MRKERTVWLSHNKNNIVLDTLPGDPPTIYLKATTTLYQIDIIICKLTWHTIAHIIIQNHTTKPL